MAKDWTESEIAFLRDNYKKLPWREIAESLGRTKVSCCAKAGRMGLLASRSHTASELETIRRMYPDHTTEEVAAEIGRSVSSVYNWAYKLGLKKTPEYLRDKTRQSVQKLLESGQAHRFPKGNVPVNKGLRRPGWAPGRMKETQFKKGQKGHNWKPVGTTRVDTDGYTYIKIAEPNKWALLHRIVWMEHHGPIPKGMNVVFKDNNKRNTDISNLEMITRADLMSRNTYHNYPEPVKSMIHQFAGFRRKLNSQCQKTKYRIFETCCSKRWKGCLTTTIQKWTSNAPRQSQRLHRR